MGIGMFSSSSLGCSNNEHREVLPNPDPKNYTIIRSEFINGHLIIEIKYHDCTNYEGKKILVYNRCTLEELVKQGLIDPHFSDNINFFSPIARFEPTNEGWWNAQLFVELF